jgi:hypothetical protein
VLYRVAVSKNARVMRVQSTSGSVRVNGKSADRKDVTNGYFCVKDGGCKCPKGQAFADGELVNLGATDPAPVIAVSGGRNGGKGRVTEVPFRCAPGRVSVVIKGMRPGYPQVAFAIAGYARPTGGSRLLAVTKKECPPACTFPFEGKLEASIASTVMTKPAFTGYFSEWGYPYAIKSITGCTLHAGERDPETLRTSFYDGTMSPCTFTTRTNRTITITLQYLPFVAMVASGSIDYAGDVLQINAASQGPLGNQNVQDQTCEASTSAPPVCAYHMYPDTPATAMAETDSKGRFVAFGGPCAGQGGTTSSASSCSFTVPSEDVVISVAYKPACTYQVCPSPVALVPNPLPPGFAGSGG